MRGYKYLRKDAAKGIFEMDNKFNEILNHFAIQPEVSSYGNGHINETYVVGKAKRYILQKINTNVFRDPEAVMRNIMLVTEHVRRAVAPAGDPDRHSRTRR